MRGGICVAEVAGVGVGVERCVAEVLRMRVYDWEPCGGMNCLGNALGGGSAAADSDTLYKLPAGVPLCSGTQVSPAQCACGGGGDCIPV